MGAALMAMGAFSVPKPTTYSLAVGIVSAMLVFQLVYVATLGPLYYTLVSEIPTGHLRDKSVRISAVTNVITMYGLRNHHGHEASR